ncbi:CLCA_X family protein [Alkalimonas collagenimarina]|uniref:CLCA_X family protein n=1 Tax=Alkalimonas collagenimarina TaxID=400390 RepID=A0ABT9GXB4_9GAMM|nr:CLCA_X family protein [Alkalimonas collagenimarina]MDP4535702.1 CLCA_X family protein [Alkalimonas collagenimarina]
MSRLYNDFYRNGPNHRAGADVSFADIVKLFGFRGIRVGRWVTAEEQHIAANLFFDALCDLQQLLQVPAKVISLNQTLTLTFGIGGQPGVCAHYQPRGRILALAKNAGAGSLAHEWFHAFDHYIAPKLFPSAHAHHFASRCFINQHAFHPHPLSHILLEGYKTLLLSADGQQPSAFFNRCIQLDKARQQLYLSQPEELCARAFEAMLQAQPLKNHFLVSGTRQSELAKAGAYPNQAELDALGDHWFRYFALLGNAINAQP